MQIRFHLLEEVDAFYRQALKRLEAAALQHWVNSLIMVDGEEHEKVGEKFEHTLEALDRLVEDWHEKLKALETGGEECPPSA